MKRTISAGDARKRLGELLEGVYYRGDEVVIERAGKPMAVVIPAARYEVLGDNRSRLLDAIERVHEANRGVPVAELMADVEAAIEEVREGSEALGE